MKADKMAGTEKKARLILREEPDWLMEAVSCLSGSYMLDSEEWLKKEGALTEAQKREKIAPYLRYRDAMRAELEPLFAQYPLLMNFIDREAKELESIELDRFSMDSYLVAARELLSAADRPDEGQIRECTAEWLGVLFEEGRQESGGHRDAPEHPVKDLPDLLDRLSRWKSNEDRYKMILLYTQCTEVIDALRELREPCAEAGRRCLPLVGERMGRFRRSIQAFASPWDLLEATGYVDWSAWGEETDIHVIPGIVACNTMRFHFTDKGEGAGPAKETPMATIDIGLDVFEEIKRQRSGEEDDRELVSRLKAISDPTRLKILRILAKEPKYLQELSRELSLTPATVSHHLGVLLEEELVTVQLPAGKKRVYYRSEPEKLRILGGRISRLGQPKERDTKYKTGRNEQ